MQRIVWEQKPQRTVQWETLNDETIVVLVPKFKSALLQRWILPILAKPYFRVKLDHIGSMFWKLSDGSRTLGEIRDEMKTTFGERIEPVDERLGRFVYQLYKGGLITFR